LPLSAYAAESSVQLTAIEWYNMENIEKENPHKASSRQIPTTDNAMSNPDFKLLSFHWDSTANYLINPANKYHFSASDVVKAITASADTWDAQTGAIVFSYSGTADLKAGKRDGYNVVSWGNYKKGVLAVTYLWRSGTNIVETDTLINELYEWSLSDGAGKMDLQNIMTHEFGHWCGLDDLYADKDYWLTMYGYSDYGETYKRTLGLGDTLGLKAVYGA
jgi:hypothetical protein